MNLSELITKLLHIERDLIEQGIEVNTVEVNVNSDYWSNSVSVSEINIHKDSIELLINLSGF